MQEEPTETDWLDRWFFGLVWSVLALAATVAAAICLKHC